MTDPGDHDEQDPAPEHPTTDEPVDPLSQPVVGGDDTGEPAQGEGAPDSY